MSERGNRGGRRAISAGRSDIAATAAYYASSVVVGLGSAALGPTLPALALQTRVSLSQAGLLFTARSLGNLIGSALAASPLDRGWGRSLLVLALLASAGMTALVPVAPHFLMLLLVFVLWGAAHAVISVGTNTLLVWTHGGRVGPFMNGLHFFFGVGSLVAPILVALVLFLPRGVAWAYWISALLTVPLSLLVLRLEIPSLSPSSRDAPPRPPDRLLFGFIALFFFLYTGAEVGFGGWVFSWAVAEHGVSQTVSAYLTSAFWGAFTLGRLVSIPLTIRIRAERVLFGSLLGALTSLALLLVLGGSKPVLWLGTVGAGLCMAYIFPGTLSFVQARVSITGRTISRLFFCSSLGAMALPWLVGVLFGVFGPRAMIPALLIDLTLSLLVFALLCLSATGRRRLPAS